MGHAYDLVGTRILRDCEILLVPPSRRWSSMILLLAAVVPPRYGYPPGGGSIVFNDLQPEAAVNICNCWT